MTRSFRIFLKLLGLSDTWLARGVSGMDRQQGTVPRCEPYGLVLTALVKQGARRYGNRDGTTGRRKAVMEIAQVISVHGTFREPSLSKPPNLYLIRQFRRTVRWPSTSAPAAFLRYYCRQTSGIVLDGVIIEGRPSVTEVQHLISLMRSRAARSFQVCFDIRARLLGKAHGPSPS